MINTQERNSARAECQSLMMAFAAYVDARRYEAFVELFTPDGVFERASGTVRGHAEIRRFLDARPGDVDTRHACTTTHVELVDDDSARGVCYSLVFRVPVTGPETAAAADCNLVQYDDRYRRTAQGWRIATRVARVVCELPHPAARGG